MGVKHFVQKHWKWILLVLATLGLIALVFTLLGALYGAGVSTVAWFSAKQIKKVQTVRDEVVTEHTQIQSDLSAEQDRQVQADANLEATVEMSRDAVHDTWDNADALPVPGLED